METRWDDEAKVGCSDYTRHVQFGTCYFHFFGPLRSETNGVLLFHTRDLLPELVLFFEHFLDHFWTISGTLSPGLIHF